jgi:hypothetical protein
MDTEYIQFEAPGNPIEAKDKSAFKRSIKNFGINVLTKVFPVANPDFEEKIDDVKYWLVECDKTSGIPEREIGLDKSGQVIMKMPFENNVGYWTDNNMLLWQFKERFEVSEVTKETFEQQWSSFDNNLTGSYKQ